MFLMQIVKMGSPDESPGYLNRLKIHNWHHGLLLDLWKEETGLQVMCQIC